MPNASRDENGVPTLLGASTTDGKTPVRVYADPDTHRLLVQGEAGATGPAGPTGPTGPAAAGASGSFTTVDLKTVTVVDGLITVIAS